MKKLLLLSFVFLTSCGGENISLDTVTLNQGSYVEEREPNFVQTLSASGVQEPNVNNIFRFGKVNSYMYRGGLPTESDLKALKEFKIKTVISFRGLGDPNEKFQIAEEKKTVESLGMKFLNIQVPFDKPVSNTTIKSFFSAVNNTKNQPLFVHCKGGRDRTGIMVALHQIKYSKFTSAKAIEQMKEYTFNPIDYPIFAKQITEFKSDSIK